MVSVNYCELVNLINYFHSHNLTKCDIELELSLNMLCLKFGRREENIMF